MGTSGTSTSPHLSCGFHNVLGPTEPDNGLVGPRIQVEDNYDGFIEIAEPDDPIATPPFDEKPEHLTRAQAQAIWEWVWDQTIQMDFGDGDGLQPPDISDVLSNFRDGSASSVLDTPEGQAEAWAITERGFNEALAAHRDNTGGIPILQLQRIDEND